MLVQSDWRVHLEAAFRHGYKQAFIRKDDTEIVNLRYAPDLADVQIPVQVLDGPIIRDRSTRFVTSDGGLADIEVKFPENHAPVSIFTFQ